MPYLDLNSKLLMLKYFCSRCCIALKLFVLQSQVVFSVAHSTRLRLILTFSLYYLL